MKVILRGYGTNMTQQQRFAARAQAADMTRTRSTSAVPGLPTNLVAQAAPRGILLSWGLPAGFNVDISRWRVYKDDESNLYHEITDRGVRQFFVETTAGATPPITNLFVSSMNALGYESAKVQVQAQAIAETGAPSMPPSTPSAGGSSGGYSGGLIQKGGITK